MTKNKKDYIELHLKLSAEILKNEQLQEENSRLKEQGENLRILYITTLEQVTRIENNLEEKIKKTGGELSEESACINENVRDLHEKYAQQFEINEQLLEEIKFLKKDNEKLRLLFVSTTEFSSDMENEQDVKYIEANRQAITDPLTGIYNRVKFDKAVLQEIEKMKKSDYQFHIIMFDIDRFKQINDTYGHEAGDKVLLGITGIVNKLIRKNDIFARWGGEEFMILLPDTDKNSADTISERTRSKIETAVFELDGQVTCSFGVTEYRPHESVSTFIKRVDKAMYQAKHQGRNRVVSL
ncbi:MAG: GGDEF domain-containing protein [Brevinematales bacterium]|nr:GGDEF domain-containing protein [Brevinematales bacterium]